MVEGGDQIVLAEWKTVSNIIQRVCNFLLINVSSFGSLLCLCH